MQSGPRIRIAPYLLAVAFTVKLSNSTCMPHPTVPIAAKPLSGTSPNACRSPNTFLPLMNALVVLFLAIVSCIAYQMLGCSVSGRNPVRKTPFVEDTFAAAFHTVNFDDAAENSHPVYPS